MTPRPRRAPEIPLEPSISDYGLIGDMRTAALVDRWGRLDWLCWPRFDSAPLFRRLLDPRGGACWQVAPSVPFEAQRRYAPDSNVLETTFTSDHGVLRLSDGMVVADDDRSGSELFRIVEAEAGAVPVRMWLRAAGGFEGGPLAVHGDGRTAVVDRPVGPSAVVTVSEDVAVQGEGDLVVDTVVRPARPFVAVLADRPVAGPLVQHALAAAAATTAWWRRWVGRCNLPGIRRNDVVGSALALKLLHHRPTRAVVAAPTTSLPERVGGGRNWDYRYTWLRDSAMTVLALQRLGHHEEAMAFWDWLASAAARHGHDLSIAYTLDGDPLPGEYEANDLPGYRNSRPVRVGNAAGDQRQHDVYGHVMIAAGHCYRHMDMDAAAPQQVLQKVADLAAQRWHRPDDSIWEVRDGRSHHTYSRMMCWRALDEAVRLARDGALDGDAAVWVRERDAVRDEVLRHGWNAEVGAFTSTIGGDELDAAVLTAPLIGFLPADDPRCRATREKVRRGLDDGGLVRRYRFDDGLGPPDGAFLLCTLWLADNHTLDGDPDRGEELLERVLATANDLGLLAEEADPRTGEPVGNFPQALTHLGVIETITRLGAARSGRAGGDEREL